MKLINTLLAFSFLTVIASCSSSSRVRYDYDPEVNFASLKTYDWMKQPATSGGGVKAGLARNTLLDKRIKNAVNRQLAAKGLKQDSSNPDFVVAYHVGVEDKIDVQDWGYNYGRRGRYWGVAARDIEVYQYRQGTLILDFVDAKTMELLWRATGTGAVKENPTPAQVEKSINEAVAKFFEKFPPTPST